MMRSLLIGLFLVAAARPAAAEVVGVVVTGEPTMQPQLVSQLQAWLKKRGYQIEPSPMPPDAVNTLVDCFVIEDDGCARAVIEKRAKSTIVYARVDLQKGGDLERTATLLAYWFAKGQPAAAARQFCSRCNDATLMTVTDALMNALIATTKTGRRTGKLTVTSPVLGAGVRLDGKDVGQTPLYGLEVLTGPHQLVLERGTRRSEPRVVEVRADEELRLEVDVPDGRPERSRSASGRGAPIAMMIGGGALVAGGIALVAVDEDGVRDTATLGVGVGAVGAAAAVGGYLWYRATGRSDAPVVAGTGANGFIAGWAGRF